MHLQMKVFALTLKDELGFLVLSQKAYVIQMKKYKDTFEIAKELRTKENAYKAYDNSRAVLTSVSKLISAHGTVEDFQY